MSTTSELTSEQIALAHRVIRAIPCGPLDPGAEWFEKGNKWLEERIEAYTLKEKIEAAHAGQDALKKQIADEARDFYINSGPALTVSDAVWKALRNYEVTA